MRVYVLAITDSGIPRPAGGGWVRLVGDSARQSLAAAGVADLLAPGPGRWQVEAGSIGYEPTRGAVTVPRDSGAVAVVVLRRARTVINEFCGRGYETMQR